MIDEKHYKLSHDEREFKRMNMMKKCMVWFYMISSINLGRHSFISKLVFFVMRIAYVNDIENTNTYPDSNGYLFLIFIQNSSNGSCLFKTLLLEIRFCFKFFFFYYSVI